MPLVSLHRDTSAIRLLRQISGMLALARVLLKSQRFVDLQGLQDLTGRLCAASLDLPPAQGRALRPRLTALLAEMDMLADICRARQGRGS